MQCVAELPSEAQALHDNHSAICADAQSLPPPFPYVVYVYVCNVVSWHVYIICIVGPFVYRGMSVIIPCVFHHSVICCRLADDVGVEHGYLWP